MELAKDTFVIERGWRVALLPTEDTGQGGCMKRGQGGTKVKAMHPTEYIYNYQCKAKKKKGGSTQKRGGGMGKKGGIEGCNHTRKI